jgi:hypothetical protein
MRSSNNSQAGTTPFQNREGYQESHVQPLPPPPINSPRPSPDKVSKKKNKCVGFDRVAVYEFPVILGDNPCVSSVAPTTIDWKHQYFVEINLNYYETYYCPRRKHKRRGRNNWYRG